MAIKISNNEVKASDLNLPAAGIISDEVVVSDVTLQRRKDKEGNLTDDIECVRYTCMDPKTYSCFKLKVETIKPVISKEDIENSETPIFIRIPVDDTTIKPYAIEYGKAKVSIIAPYVELVKASKA